MKVKQSVVKRCSNSSKAAVFDEKRSESELGFRKIRVLGKKMKLNSLE